jgi:two-component system repressor protein LuxO
VLDLLLPDSNGMEILQYVRRRYPDTPAVVVTVTNSVNIAVEAMKRGAFDFIVKPFPPARLALTIKNALERKALVAEVTELRQLTGQSQFHDFVGASAAMQAVYRLIDSVAASKTSVFIKGESGTGKELAAHAIHKAGPRRMKPFVAFNCAAVPRELMESHLFGHVKGSFPGAVHDKPGAIREADGGTLFLDEVCQMPLELQARLLRFLQTGEIMPIGGTSAEMADVRVLAATNLDPLAHVHAGGFREDLYYRLHAIPLELPPLREREEDIPMLAQHFLATFNAEENKQFSAFDPAVMEMFRRYDWPGNVRQLENIVRNVVVLNAGATVTRAMIPKDLQRFAGEGLSPANQNAQPDVTLVEATSDDAIKPLWLAEKDAVMRALEATQKDIGRAAALLQVSPSTLYRKLQAWKDQSAVA